MDNFKVTSANSLNYKRNVSAVEFKLESVLWRQFWYKNFLQISGPNSTRISLMEFSVAVKIQLISIIFQLLSSLTFDEICNNLSSKFQQAILYSFRSFIPYFIRRSVNFCVHSASSNRSFFSFFFRISIRTSDEKSVIITLLLTVKCQVVVSELP